MNDRWEFKSLGTAPLDGFSQLQIGVIPDHMQPGSDEGTRSLKLLKDFQGLPANSIIAVNFNEAWHLAQLKAVTESRSPFGNPSVVLELFERITLRLTSFAPM